MTLFPTTIGNSFYQPMVPGGLIRINRFGVADDAITGRSDSMLKERAARAGAVTLLDEPVRDDMLLNSLAQALAQAEFRAL